MHVAYPGVYEICLRFMSFHPVIHTAETTPRLHSSVFKFVVWPVLSRRLPGNQQENECVTLEEICLQTVLTRSMVSE